MHRAYYPLDRRQAGTSDDVAEASIPPEGAYSSSWGLSSPQMVCPIVRSSENLMLVCIRVRVLPFPRRGPSER